MRVVFMGTPDFAVPTLKALNNSKHEIIYVYTAPPVESGRGMRVNLSKVHSLANDLDLKVHTPKSLKSTEEVEFLKSLKADIAIVVAYGMLLPKTILEIPKYGCLNLHPSALPRWRGAAPLQRTIEAGDKKSSICIMQMDEGLDTGDVIVSKELEISEEMTAGELHDIAANIGADLMLEALDLIEKGEAKPIKQSNDGVTYAKKINKEEAKLDFSRDVKEIHDKIRAFSPYPGCFFIYKNEKIKILKSSYILQKNNISFGEFVDDNFTISCKNGLLKPEILQREGKKPLEISEFLKGFRF